MSSSSYLSLISVGATNAHHYAAHGIVADSTLCPPPSFNVTGNDMQVAMAPSQAAHQLFFAQFTAAGEEPKSTADLPAPSIIMDTMKLKGPDSCRRDEHSQRSDISSDHAMAEVCSSTSAAAQIRFQPLSNWALESNQHDSLSSQARNSAHFGSTDAMRLLAIAAEAEVNMERANMKDAMKTEGPAKMDIEACYGYPQVKAAASMPADLNFSRDYDKICSINHEERGVMNESCVASRNAAASHGVMSSWFEPLSSSSSIRSLPAEHNLMRPTFRESLQPNRSISHEHFNGSWLANYKDLQQQYCRSPLINNANVCAGDQDQKNIHQRRAEAEASYFHTQTFDSAEAEEEGLRINGNSGVGSRVPHIPVNMSMQQSVPQQIRNMSTGIANVASKELLLLNRVQAAGSGAFHVISNNVSMPQCSSASAYDAENAGAVDMDTQQLLLRSSLLHNYSPLAAPSGAWTQQLADQVVPAGGEHQFDTVATINPNCPSAPWDESYCKMSNHNLSPSSTSFVMQQAQAETPASRMIRSAIVSGNSAALMGNNSGHIPAAVFSQQSAGPLIPVVNVAGGLSRYIQPEDLSLHRPPSSDFLSLDCTYSRSGPVSLLRTSKYLKPAQQLLEECCNVKLEYSTRATHRSTAVESKELPHKTADIHGSSGPKQQLNAEERCHLQMRKARLIGMVEELDRRYQQYQDHMQLIITSFESATGMGAAVPYTALARKLISRQFRALRDAIGEHIQVACRTLGEDICNVPVLNKGETPRLRILDQRIRHHRNLQQVGMLQQHQSWRPQRGLPERSVAVLRAWLFEHFLHPYPKDSEKLMLARLTGLTRSQVANWFINARVRLWKPMVEQMCAEESKEDDSQDAAQASMAQYGQRDNIDCAWSGGHLGDSDVTMQVEHNNGASNNHYCQKSEHFSYKSDDRTISHKEMTTRHGVSLTLGLQHSSSVESLPPNSYNPNNHFNLQSASGDVNYTFV